MSLKDDIKSLLEKKDFDGVVELAARERGVLKYLRSLLYSENDLLHWRAAEAFGRIAKYPDIMSREKVNTMLTRLFVSIEDKSGGNGWGSIEAIGAIVAARPDEFSKAIPRMFSYIWDGRVRKGLLWSMRRIGQERPDLLKDKIFYIVGLLRNPSNTTRGHAAWALGVIGDSDVRVLEGLVIDVKETLKGLLDDDSRIRVYDNGELQERTISQIAKEALAALNGRQG